mmetsp:Transcript_28198/g.60527  ORF Transcript_28198/g.60527 Transcript_28198/m.60527 type:complete len:293 (+) Transcript_28198:379-1257(+)
MGDIPDVIFFLASNDGYLVESSGYHFSVACNDLSIQKGSQPPQLVECTEWIPCVVSKFPKFFFRGNGRIILFCFINSIISPVIYIQLLSFSIFPYYRRALQLALPRPRSSHHDRLPPRYAAGRQNHLVLRLHLEHAHQARLRRPHDHRHGLLHPNHQRRRLRAVDAIGHLQGIQGELRGLGFDSEGDHQGTRHRTVHDHTRGVLHARLHSRRRGGERRRALVLPDARHARARVQAGIVRGGGGGRLRPLHTPRFPRIGNLGGRGRALVSVPGSQSGPNVSKAEAVSGGNLLQ